MAQLTTNALRATWRGKDRWLSDGGPRGGGRLVARITREGPALYFQYFTPSAGQERKRFLPLGPYDQDGTRGLSLPKARDKAAELSQLFRSGEVDLHSYFARQRDAEERARRERDERAREAAEDAKRGTLSQLLASYVTHLERQGKAMTARDVRSIFANHVPADLLERKARDIGVEQFADIISKVVEAGHGRTGDKLRSYLRAAYQLALEARTNPVVPVAMRTFGVTVNVVASIGALSRFNRARDRVLSATELGAYLRHVDALLPGARRDALQLLHLLGGQRPQQLLRATPADVDLDAAIITLRDGKGARSQPRLHALPLVKDAAAIVGRRLSALKEGEPLFSTDGQTAMRHETVSAMVADISEAMLKAKEAREAFQLRDLRRTAETMLASLKVSSDVRAQLQSHGLGGVQQRHYNRHDYMLEKKQALEKWARHLAKLKAGETATVTEIGGQKRGEQK